MVPTSEREGADIDAGGYVELNENFDSTARCHVPSRDQLKLHETRGGAQKLASFKTLDVLSLFQISFTLFEK